MGSNQASADLVPCNALQQPDAWDTANVLLLAQDLPVEPRLFAAQTFRMKVWQIISSAEIFLKPTLRMMLIQPLGWSARQRSISIKCPCPLAHSCEIR